MPPRRALPIRSRLDGNPSSSVANGTDGGGAPAPDARLSSTSAAGNLSGAKTGSSDASSNHKSNHQLPIHDRHGGKEGKGGADSNGKSSPGRRSDKDAKVLSELEDKPAVTDVHDVMVSTLILMIMFT